MLTASVKAIAIAFVRTYTGTWRLLAVARMEPAAAAGLRYAHDLCVAGSTVNLCQMFTVPNL
jgi:hypothetical protein